MRCIRNPKPGDNCNNQIVAGGDHRRAPIVGQLQPLPGQLVRSPCAVIIQRKMLARNTDVPDGKRIVFRIGINVGDIIIEGSDIFGDGVNIAARLESICEPGGLCISDTACDQVRGKLPLTFADGASSKSRISPVRYACSRLRRRQSPSVQCLLERAT
jgi:class 3 adenylate cyclase